MGKVYKYKAKSQYVKRIILPTATMYFFIINHIVSTVFYQVATHVPNIKCMSLRQ